MRTRGQKEVGETWDEAVYLTLPFLWVQIWRKCFCFLFWLCWKNTEYTAFCSCCLFRCRKWTQWQSKIGQRRPRRHLPEFISVPKQHEWAPTLPSAPDAGTCLLADKPAAEPDGWSGLWPQWGRPFQQARAVRQTALAGTLWRTQPGTSGSLRLQREQGWGWTILKGYLVLIKLRWKKRYKLTSLTGQVSSSQWDLPWPSCATS